MSDLTFAQLGLAFYFAISNQGLHCWVETKLTKIYWAHLTLEMDSF